MGSVSRDDPAQLSHDILTEWERLIRLVPRGAPPLPWLARATGIDFGALDFARKTRNEVAHPDGPLDTRRLRRALNVIRRASRRLDQTEDRPRRIETEYRPRSTSVAPPSRPTTDPPKTQPWGLPAHPGRTTDEIPVRQQYIASYLGFGIFGLIVLATDRRSSVRYHAIQSTLLFALAWTLMLVTQNGYVTVSLLIPLGAMGLLATGDHPPPRLPLIGPGIDRLVAWISR